MSDPLEDRRPNLHLVSLRKLCWPAQSIPNRRLRLMLMAICGVLHCEKFTEQLLEGYWDHRISNVASYEISVVAYSGGRDC